MSVKTVQAVINGSTYTLTLNSSTGRYEASITAPSTTSYKQSGHYYDVTIKATDDAGNVTTVNSSDSTLGSSCRLVVKETTAPVSSISYPTSSSYITSNKPTIKWTITDSGSGVNPSTIGITIDSGSKVTGDAITKTATTNGYSCSYTPTSALSDGKHTIKVDGTDYDGNVATSVSSTFTVDTVAPTLTVSSPADKLITNTATLTVSGTTNDATSSPVSVSITLNGSDVGSVTVSSSGSFSKSITLKSGSNTIVVTSKDAAGKTTSVTRTVTLDQGAPVIKSITITPNPVDVGKTVLISVEVTD